MLGSTAAQPDARRAVPAWARAEAGGSLVRWQPWDEATVRRARSEGRNVYVFVGTESAELTRTTLAETFGRQETADWLNENFICVLVDAAAQPEVGAFAQHFLATVRQARGWPAHLWLTPEFRPYDGAGYLPATEEWGRPGFLKSARAALDRWQQDPAGARALAGEAEERMRPVPPDQPGPGAIEALLERGTEAWIAASDERNGGFGTAPKQPEPEVIRFLLDRGARARATALAAARAIVTGAVHDRERGGFYRRTLDAEWREPHRQKALGDQARVALALFAAAEVGGASDLRAAGERALGFALGALRRTDGTWAALWDGTEADAEPVLRGQARAAELGLLVLALARSEDPGRRAFADELARELAATLAANEAGEGVTPHDRLAVAAALRTVGDPAGAARETDRLAASFDRQGGVYLAAPVPGGSFRAPAPPEPFRAEAFALIAAGMAGADVAPALRTRLWWDSEYEPLPAGGILLALSASP